MKENIGKVWLAGAGPGDAGLLTVKAAHLIESADVIVYDALISTELLSRIPQDAETIYVGKHSGNHPVPQHEINQILVREAKKGKKVLRLKEETRLSSDGAERSWRRLSANRSLLR